MSARKKNKKKIIIGVGAVAVAAVAGVSILGVMNSDDSINQVEVVTATIGDVQQTIDSTGTVESEEKKVYYSPVNAKADKVDVKEGQTVKSGDTLVEFDEKDLEKDQKKAELNLKSTELDNENSVNKSDSAAKKQQDAKGNVATLKEQIEAQENYVANLKAQISQATSAAQAKAAQETAQKSAAETAAKEAQQKASQKAYTEALNKYNNETLPAYQRKLETLNTDMNNALLKYNNAENDYQVAFQIWSNDQTDENKTALSQAEKEKSNAEIAYNNAKSAYEDYKSQKPSAPNASDYSSATSSGDLSDSDLSDGSLSSDDLDSSSTTTATADTSALEAELEKASSKLSELQTQLSTEQATADADANTLTDEEKEKMEITTNLSEIDEMTAEELVESAKEGIKADFNGVVTKVSVVEGSTTTQGAELVTLENTDKVDVNINVSKYDYSKLEVGQSADITIAGKEYEGVVNTISHSATQNEKGAAIIAVSISISNPDEDIFLGVDAKVTIHAKEANDVVILPTEAVNIGKNGSFCYVLEDNVITEKEITTGISSDDYVEITDGIEAGDEVIKDIGSLEVGMTAEPVTTDDSTEEGA